MTRRVGIIGFGIESNRFAPVSTEEDFAQRILRFGEDARPIFTRSEDSGFDATMRSLTDYELVPISFSFAESGGQVEHGFFKRFKDRTVALLHEAGQLDGVFIMGHGAGLTTELDDMDGPFYCAVREVVGPDVPILVTLDLHGNVSPEMIRATDVLIAYQTNPHLDGRERAADAARLMIEMWNGMRPKVAFHRLPLITAQIAQLTVRGQPYGDLYQWALAEAAADDRIANVSILSGFAFSDSQYNGMAILVTSRGDESAAQVLCDRIAERAWSDRERYLRETVSVGEAVKAALAHDGSTGPLILADVADNPGGGGRGNTPYLIRGLIDAAVEGVQVGVVYDAALVQEATRLGEGAVFNARFNLQETAMFSDRWEAEAKVECLLDGKFQGKLGMSAGSPVNLGPSALLRVGGVQLCVISFRTQCFGADFLQYFGLDPTRARVIVVKSRGHFRAGFEHLTPKENILEVAAPGLTTPDLATVKWQDLPRPCYPLDRDTEWQVDSSA